MTVPQEMRTLYLLADRDFVTQEEFEAVRAMAQHAREENEALKVRIAALEKLGGVFAQCGGLWKVRIGCLGRTKAG